MDFKEHLYKYLPIDEVEKLMDSLKEDSYNALLLNEDKLSKEQLFAHFKSISKHPLIDNAYYFDKKEDPLGKSIFHELGAFYIQEPSAMLVSYLLKPNKDDVVLDMCAAPGGKSIQASLIMNNEGLIISNDISFPRIKALYENIERLGRSNIVITNNDFSKIYHHYIDTFDKIILDAPCSGSGMFRKDNKMIDDWSMNKVIKNSIIQKELILQAYKMLKPSGIMVYSTCSFSYEEDEEVVKYLLDNTDASLINIEDNKYFYKSESKIGIHLFPHIFKGEGHYICLIQKPGISNKKIPIELVKVSKDNMLSLINIGFNYKFLNVIKNGVLIGESLKKNIKYSFHYASYVKDFENIIEIDYETLQNYIKGNSLNIKNVYGDVLIKYQNLNVDIAKGDGKSIKNKLPNFIKNKNLY